MPRQKRADEGGCIYHALNRGNGRQTIFHKDEDQEAFLRVLGEGLDRYPVADKSKGSGLFDVKES